MSDYARVLALVRDMNGPTLWRVLFPFTELQRQGYVGIEWGRMDDNRLANIVHHFDAIILQRLNWPKAERTKEDKWFDIFNRAGIAVIYELDDDFTSDEYVRRAIELFGRPEDEVLEHRDMILEAICRSDGVTTSNNVIAAKLSGYTDKPIKVVGNYIDLRWWKAIQKIVPRKVVDFTIGWAGGARPEYDIEQMAIAWGRIAKKYPKIKFVVQGYQPDSIYDQMNWERIISINFLPIEKYPIGMTNIDIGCCPLANTAFNVCKTPIKAMEYAASDAAVVASPTLYSKIIEDGIDGLLAETADEWEAALTKLIEDYTFRRQITKRLLRKIRREYSLENNVGRWVTAWTDIVNQYKQARLTHIVLPNIRQVAEYGVRL